MTEIGEDRPNPSYFIIKHLKECAAELPNSTPIVLAFSQDRWVSVKKFRVCTHVVVGQLGRSTTFLPKEHVEEHLKRHPEDLVVELGIPVFCIDVPDTD